MLKRAYSILTVKEVNADQRTFAGMASTPEVDRMGDVVVSSGLEFKNPAPLLLYHDSTRPVGSVQFGRATADGLPFTASIPDVAEAGTLRERVQEAWQSVKYGLIKGVSIGFNPVEEAIKRIDTGFLFGKAEVLELSLVAIPANASATIHTIRSIDTKHLVALDKNVSSKTKTTHASVMASVDHGPEAKKRMTIKEQIKNYEATKEAKSARMSELMDAAAEAGTTLDESQSQEYDGLKAEVDAIDEHLKRLNEREAQSRKEAKPVDGKNAEEASKSRAGVVVQMGKVNRPAGVGFARLAIAKMSSFLSHGEYSAHDIAKARWADDTEVVQAAKGSVPGATTTDPTWAGPLVYAQNLASEFVEFLRPQTIIGKFGTGNIPSLRRIPFNVRVVGQTSGGTAYWVGQSQPKPLTRADFVATSLGFAKVAAIAVISDELARFSSPSAETLVRDELAAAVVERVDIDLLDPTVAAVSGVNPASLTNGLTPMTQSGTDAAAVRADLASMLTTFLATNNTPTSAVLIMPATLALVLSLQRNDLSQREFPDLGVNGGSLEGIPVITTQYAANESGAGNLVVLVNASDIFLADDGQVTVDVSREASLQMLDNPTNNAGSSPVATSLISMFQTNSLAIRAERYINWAKRRSGAVVYMDDVTWGGANSPA